VGYQPDVTYFKPAGVPICELEEVTVTLDELEALRLADLEGLYQEQAAEKMKVSRATFGRIVETARRKVAQGLIHGKALRLEGGVVVVKQSHTIPGKGKSKPAPDSQGVKGRHRRNRQTRVQSTLNTSKGKKQK